MLKSPRSTLSELGSITITMPLPCFPCQSRLTQMYPKTSISSSWILFDSQVSENVQASQLLLLLMIRLSWSILQNKLWLLRCAIDKPLALTQKDSTLKFTWFKGPGWGQMSRDSRMAVEAQRGSCADFKTLSAFNKARLLSESMCRDLFIPSLRPEKCLRLYPSPTIPKLETWMFCSKVLNCQKTRHRNSRTRKLWRALFAWIDARHDANQGSVDQIISHNITQLHQSIKYINQSINHITLIT